MKKRALAALLALCLVPLSGAFAQEDPVAVQVNEYKYPLSQVQAYWDEHAQTLAQLGAVPTAQELRTYRDSVVESFVSLAIMEDKYKEFGLDVMSPLELEMIEIQTREYYDQIRNAYAQSVTDQYGHEGEEALKYADTLMAMEGFTLAAAREVVMAQTKDQRLLEHVAGHVEALTDEELDAYYEENYVKPSRERYQNRIDLYEQEVLALGAASYYIPAGYRYIRALTYPLTQEEQTQLEEARALTDGAQQVLEKAENQLYGLKVLGEDITQAQKAQQEAQQQYQLAFEAQTELETRLIDARRAQMDEDLARLKKGETFEAVSNDQALRQDQLPGGFMVCSQTTLLEALFVETAMALETVGEISDPILTLEGVQLLEYAADLPEGAAVMDSDARELMGLEARLKAQYEVLNAQIAQWRSDYEITLNISGLKVPECLNP